MSETKALVLLFVGTAVFAGIAGVVLALTEASGIVYGFTVTSLAGIGGWIAGGIVMHYSKRKERRKREEFILSR